MCIRARNGQKPSVTSHKRNMRWQIGGMELWILRADTDAISRPCLGAARGCASAGVLNQACRNASRIRNDHDRTAPHDCLVHRSQRARPAIYYYHHSWHSAPLAIELLQGCAHLDLASPLRRRGARRLERVNRLDHGQKEGAVGHAEISLKPTRKSYGCEARGCEREAARSIIAPHLDPPVYCHEMSSLTVRGHTSRMMRTSEARNRAANTL
eukprot:scaffold2188_cov32-Tisochrysis_lutea.AAC.5